MGRRAGQGKERQADAGDLQLEALPLDDLLEARFDGDGRLAQIGRGTRQRIAERLDPRPPALNATELERAVQKLARGLEAIERQGAARRSPGSPAQPDPAPANAGAPVGREVVSDGLDRLEARLDALSKRLQQRLASAEEGAPAEARLSAPEPSLLEGAPPAAPHAPDRAMPTASSEPSLAISPDRETAPAREPAVTWGRLDPLAEAQPAPPVGLPASAAAPAVAIAAIPSNGSGSTGRPDLKQHFAALEARIATLQQGFDQKQIQPVREELVGLLRQVESLSRDGRSVAGAVEQVRAKLDEIETRVSAARNMTGNRLGELNERLAGLSERLGEIESEVPGFEAVREHQITLLERFDRMESLVERIASPQDLLDRIEGLRGQLQSVASQREITRVEEQILQIAERLDQLPEHLGQRPALERVEGQLQTLALEFAEARRQRQTGAGELNERLGQIGDALHDLGEASRATNFSGLEERLSEFTARLAKDNQASSETLARLEKRLAALLETVESHEAEASAEILAGLTRKMDALASAIHDQDARGARRDLDGLNRKLDQLHMSLAEHAEHLSRTQARSIEEQLEQMHGQLEALTARATEQNAQIGPFAQTLQEISERLSGLGAEDSHPLAARLSAIEGHLATLARKAGEPRAIEEQLDTIVSRLETLKGGAIHPAQIDLLLERVDAALRASAAEDRFNRLEQKLAETAVGGENLARIEQKLESGLADERFARLEQKLEELGHAYSSAAGTEGLSPADLVELSTDIVALRRELRSLPGLGDGEGNLGAMLKGITERLDRLPDTAQASNADLEAQIERVAQLLEDPSQNRLALGHIEDSLKSIEERLEETRRTVASRAGADEDGFEPQDIATVAELARGLSDDVNVLKNSAEASDKRTRDALDAVQSTLEAVVKRMAFLEREADSAAASSPQLEVEGDAPIAPIPSVLLRRHPEAEPVPGLAAEPEAAREQTGGLFSRLTSSQLLRRATGGRAESFSPEAEESEEAGDLPLEPGTDSPLNSALTGAPSSDTVRMSGGGRRKSNLGLNAGSAEAVGRHSFPEPVTSEDFLLAARRAAQAAAAEANGTREGGEGHSGIGRLAGRMKARRRAVLAGALAVAVAFAAIQFVQSQMGAEPIDLADSAQDIGDDVDVPGVVNLPALTGESVTGAGQTAETASLDTVPEAPAPTPTEVAAVDTTTPADPEAAAQPPGPEGAQAEQGRPVRTVIVREPPVTPEPTPDAVASQAEPVPPATDAPGNATGQPEVQMASAPAGDEQSAAAEVAPPAVPAAPPPQATASLSPPAAAEPPPAPAAMAPPIGLPEPVGPDRLRQAAVAGDPAAAFEVGARYAEGRGTAQDMDAAVAWYEWAAEAGLAPAQYRLGSIYEKGLGVPKDLTKAQDWYRRAAEAGNVKAMHNLAVLYAEGAGGEPDLERAGELFHKAAEHGVRDSQFNLAILHARGLGVPQDLIEAYKWFAVAAGSGDEESIKRRDIIAAAMNESDLAKAKAAAEGYQPVPLAPEANEIAMPDGGWGEDTSLQHLYSETDTVALVQKLLAEKGYDPGPPDGKLGARTVQAISAFREEAGLPASGAIDPSLVAKLQERQT
jgi:localization factor PodJL